jgi:hypothetical protein
MSPPQKPAKSRSRWTPDPFPQPRTVPSGWDASALAVPTPETSVPGLTEWPPEDFAEPRTMPRGWDLSSLV